MHWCTLRLEPGSESSRTGGPENGHTCQVRGWTAMYKPGLGLGTYTLDTGVEITDIDQSVGQL